MAQSTPTPGNPDVIKYWAGLYGQTKHSDCMVVFMLDRSPLGGQAAEPGTSEAGPSGPGQPADRSVAIGEPLPAHSWMLCPACDKWSQQWVEWTPRLDSDGPASKRRKLSAGQAVAVTITVAGEAGSAASAAAAAPHVAEIRVAVRSEEDVPAALAVVKFAYTGLVEAGSITQALQVRRQADYLQMTRCMEACLERVREKLAGAVGAAGVGVGGGGGSSNESSSDIDAVLELYSCAPLWPDPATDPTYGAFAALLTEAKRRLVAHFGDALAVLSKKHLHKQMVVLPAMGLEALLESEDFGTDSESSVVLVLAEWMQVNYSTTDAATRRRLCGLLRLVQCSRAYLDWVLPALALDHLLHPNSPAGWLPITPMQVGCVARYLAASHDEQKAIKAVLEKTAARAAGMAAWLSDRPRRPCVPPTGLTFTFSADRKALVKAFARVAEGKSDNLWPSLDDDRPDNMDYIPAQGLAWDPKITYTRGKTTAGFSLGVALPWAYDVLGARAGTPAVLAGGLEEDVATAISALRGTPFPVSWPRARLCVHSWAPGPGGDQQPQQAVIVRLTGSGIGQMLRSRGQRATLKLAPVPEDAQQADAQQQRQAREEAVEAQWAAYLKDGNLTGSVTLLPAV